MFRNIARLGLVSFAVKRYVFAVLAALACMLGLVASAAGTASAATRTTPDALSVTTVYNSNGEAGIYAFSSYPFFQADAGQTPLTLAMEGNSDTSDGVHIFGVGGELCVESTGFATQEGVVYNGNGTFDLLAESSATGGDLVAKDPTTASYLNANCTSGGSLPVTSGFNATDPLDSYAGATIVLSEVPEGDTIAWSQHQVGDKVYAYGQDITQAIAENTVALNTDGRQNFDVNGIGTVQNQADLSAPDSNNLTDLLAVTMTSGDTTSGPSYFDAVHVASNASGNAADPVLVDGLLSAAKAPVCTTTGRKGHRVYWWTGHGKHRRHHHRWVRSTLKTTCTAGTQASIQLVEGSQVGA